MSKFMADVKELLDGIKAWVATQLSTKADASTTYSKTEVDSKLGNKADSSALTSHTGNSTIHVTSTDKSSWNGKYAKPSTGIPKTDLASAVQTSLGLADSAVQPADLEDASVAYADESGWATAAGTANTANAVAWEDVAGKPTFGTASAKDVPASGDATTTQVVMGNDTRLTDTRTPKAHTHAISEVTNLQSTLNAKYEKPSGGIPKTDLASAVQTSLGKADGAVQTSELASASVAYASKVGSSSSHPAIGSSTQPVYVDSDGAIKVATAYASATVLKATTASSAETLVKSTGGGESVGGASTPTYFLNGKPVACTSYANASVSHASTAATADALTLSGGSSTQPVYFSNGKPVACTAYSSASVNHASTADTATNAEAMTLSGTAITRGNSTTPVFFTLGVPIACTPYSSASVNYANSAGTADAVDVDNLTDVTWMTSEDVEEYLNG